MMADRPSWDDYFMKIAEDVSTRATCVRRKVGAFIWHRPDCGAEWIGRPHCCCACARIWKAVA